MSGSYLKKSVFSAVAFFGTLGILTVGYSAFVTSYPSTAAATNPLSSTEWNKMVSALQTLDTALSNFAFDSSTITATKHLIVNSSAQYVLWNAGSHTDVAAVGIKNTDSNRTWGLGVGGTGVGTVGLQGGKFGIWDTTAGLNRFTIDTAGNVGIGTNTPKSKLSIVNNVSAGGPSSSHSSYQILLYENSTNPNNSYGIGISSNTMWFNSNAYYDFYVAGTKVANIGSDGTYTKISDRNLKTGIATLSGSLDNILTLRGVSYEWKNPSYGNGKRIGVIAQEVEETFPELVRTDSDGLKTVDYAGLVAPLIEAVKDQQSQITELEKEIDELRKADSANGQDRGN